MIPPLFGKQEVGIWRVQKTLPTIWGTYMKLVTKYQISAINSCWEKCDEKWAYMFNVYKNQQNRQTGSRNLMGPKTLPTIWSLWPNIKFLPSTVTEKNATKNILDGRKDGSIPNCRFPVCRIPNCRVQWADSQIVDIWKYCYCK